MDFIMRMFVIALLAFQVYANETRMQNICKSEELFTANVVFISVHDEYVDPDIDDNEIEINATFRVVSAKWGEAINWKESDILNAQKLVAYLKTKDSDLIVFHGGLYDHTADYLIKHLQNLKARCFWPVYGYSPEPFIVFPKEMNLVIISNKSKEICVNGCCYQKFSSINELKKKIEQLEGIIYIFQKDAPSVWTPDSYRKRRFDCGSYMERINPIHFYKNQSYRFFEECYELNNKKKTIRILYSDGLDYYFFQDN